MSVPTYDDNRIAAVSLTCAQCKRQYHVPVTAQTPDPYVCIRCRRTK